MILATVRTASGTSRHGFIIASGALYDGSSEFFSRFDWKASEWSYDLDRVFRQLETDNHGETLNNDFILRRLNELPGASRVILAWASLIGTSFSFSLVQNLMSSEYNVTKRDQSEEKTSNCDRLAHLSSAWIDPVAGLQAAIQAAILVSGDDDDQFRYVKPLPCGV